ncbi:acylphosphatase [Salinithrix halophila]|uniref:Acylphosphatase n=1 Tax=Salinithrix halophila TaxID=1485204 RepID=A0ABV8JM25_9BACL
MQRKHLIVHGRVQGVGFRFHTQQAASRLGIVGWVKNNPNGTVEIDAQGEKDAIRKFLEAVRKGSPFSRVERVDVKNREPSMNRRAFDVKY